MSELVEIEFVLEQCPNCGVLFKVTSAYQRNRKAGKESFFCPNGHSMSYTKSTAEILREKLDAKEAENRKQAETIEARGKYIDALNTTIGKLEKKLRRKAAKS